MFDLLKIAGKDSIRGLIIFIVAVLIALPLGFLFLLIPYWEMHRAEIGDWVIYAAAALWMLFFLGSLLAIILVVTRRRRKVLDAVFTPLGLAGKPYLINWYQYHGIINGREVAVRFYKGPTLDILVQTTLKTRAGITERTQPGQYLAHLSQKQPIQTGIAALDGLAIYALDEQWIKTILNSEEMQTLVLRLMQAGSSWALMRQLILRPGELRLTLYRNKNLFDYTFTAQDVRAWMDDLFTLLHLAESCPAPVITAEETWAERNARSGKTTRIIMLATLGFFILLALCFTLPFLFLFQ